MPQPITLIILGNDQTSLAFHNLKTYQPYFSEILIIDTSSDKQLSALKKGSIQVIFDTLIDQDFGRLRNTAIEKASQSWIFFLDSDEQLTPPLLQNLSMLLEQPAVAYSFWRRDYFHHQLLKHGEVGHVHKVRLFQKGKVNYQGKVHEAARVKGDTIQTDLVIDHLAHRNLSTFFVKVSHYAFLQAQAEIENGKKFHLLECMTKPIAKFVVNYIFRLGFLDGFPGLCYATMMSLHSFFVRIYLYELTQTS